jgi:hypothetical protein
MRSRRLGTEGIVFTGTICKAAVYFSLNTALLPNLKCTSRGERGHTGQKKKFPNFSKTIPNF